uniref:Uncharacterized protein n=1 Tax=Moschus moschiferus TaxID=68415 RepID=A0A8C6FFM3_MOSMO
KIPWSRKWQFTPKALRCAALSSGISQSAKGNICQYETNEYIHSDLLEKNTGKQRSIIRLRT